MTVNELEQLTLRELTEIADKASKIANITLKDAQLERLTNRVKADNEIAKADYLEARIRVLKAEKELEKLESKKEDSSVVEEKKGEAQVTDNVAPKQEEKTSTPKTESPTKKLIKEAIAKTMPTEEDKEKNPIQTFEEFAKNAQKNAQQGYEKIAEDMAKKAVALHDKRASAKEKEEAQSIVVHTEDRTIGYPPNNKPTKKQQDYRYNMYTRLLQEAKRECWHESDIECEAWRESEDCVRMSKK